MDLTRPELCRLQMGAHVVLEFFITARAGAFTDRALQVAVEQLVRIVLRGIGRQIEYLNLVLMLFKPCRHYLCMMNTQIIQNQKYLLSCCRVPNVA